MVKKFFDNSWENIDFYGFVNHNDIFYVYRELPPYFSCKKGKIMPHFDKFIFESEIDEGILMRHEILSDNADQFNYLDVDTELIYYFAEGCEIGINKIPDIFVSGFDDNTEKQNAYSLLKCFLNRRRYNAKFYASNDGEYVLCENIVDYY